LRGRPALFRQEASHDQIIPPKALALLAADVALLEQGTAN